jgi:hypothetical protein
MGVLGVLGVLAGMRVGMRVDLQHYRTAVALIPGTNHPTIQRGDLRLSFSNFSDPLPLSLPTQTQIFQLIPPSTQDLTLANQTF